jgi:hypothetical protein
LVSICERSRIGAARQLASDALDAEEHPDLLALGDDVWPLPTAGHGKVSRCPLTPLRPNLAPLAFREGLCMTALAGLSLCMESESGAHHHPAVAPRAKQERQRAATRLLLVVQLSSEGVGTGTPAFRR